MVNAQWWRSDDLRNLVAHWLVDRAEIQTVSALLLYYERPWDHFEAFQACMADMAQGKQRPHVPGRDRKPKLDREAVRDIRAARAAGETRRAIGERHAVSASTVRDVEQGRLFADVA